jgi:hypothetical protein
MGQYTVTIKTDNQAFHNEDEYAPGWQLAIILRGLADDAEAGLFERKIKEINGHTVGEVTHEE